MCHYADYPSSDTFIKAIAPKYAVICCGKDNKYGHPHQVTLDTLKKNNVITYRTDLNGTVVIRSDGKNITIKPSSVVSQSVINKSPSSNNSSGTTKDNSTTPTTTNNKPSTTVDTSNNQSQTVYVIKTGEKYHQDGCSSLSNSKIAISKDDVEKKRYEPCKKCFE